MWRSLLSVLLSTAMVLPVEAGQVPALTVQEQVGQIATGSRVEAKLKAKHTKPVRGRLVAVSADRFAVQVTQGTTVDTVNLKFADVKKVVEKPQGKGTHPVVLILAGVGAGVLVLIVVFAILTHGES